MSHLSHCSFPIMESLISTQIFRVKASPTSCNPLRSGKGWIVTLPAEPDVIQTIQLLTHQLWRALSQQPYLLKIPKTTPPEQILESIKEVWVSPLSTDTPPQLTFHLRNTDLLRQPLYLQCQGVVRHWDSLIPRLQVIGDLH
jgi:hypothetical protein